MAVTRTVTQLAADLRIGDGTTAPAGAVAVVLQRIDATARALVVAYAPDAPDEIHDEAYVRLAGWLYDQDPSGSNPGGPAAMRASGAASLLNSYKVRRAGLIGGTATPSSDTGGPGVDQVAREAAARAQSTADGAANVAGGNAGFLSTFMARVQAVVESVIPGWARQPTPPSGTGGLNQGQVDARITTLRPNPFTDEEQAKLANLEQRVDIGATPSALTEENLILSSDPTEPEAYLTKRLPGGGHEGVRLLTTEDERDEDSFARSRYNAAKTQVEYLDDNADNAPFKVFQSDGTPFIADLADLDGDYVLQIKRTANLVPESPVNRRSGAQAYDELRIFIQERQPDGTPGASTRVHSVDPFTYTDGGSRAINFNISGAEESGAAAHLESTPGMIWFAIRFYADNVAVGDTFTYYMPIIAGPTSRGGGLSQQQVDARIAALRPNPFTTSEQTKLANLEQRVDIGADPGALTVENIILSDDPENPSATLTKRKADDTYEGVDLLTEETGGVVLPDGIAPSADTLDKLVYQHRTLKKTRPVHHTAKQVTWRAFGDSDVPGAGTYAGAVQVNPNLAGLADGTVWFSIPANHFLEKYTVGRTALSRVFAVAAYKGKADSEDRADALAGAVGDVVYWGGTVQVVASYSDRTPDTYEFEAYEAALERRVAALEAGSSPGHVSLGHVYVPDSGNIAAGATRDEFSVTVPAAKAIYVWAFGDKSSAEMRLSYSDPSISSGAWSPGEIWPDGNTTKKLFNTGGQRTERVVKFRVQAPAGSGGWIQGMLFVGIED